MSWRSASGFARQSLLPCVLGALVTLAVVTSIPGEPLGSSAFDRLEWVASLGSEIATDVLRLSGDAARLRFENLRSALPSGVSVVLYDADGAPRHPHPPTVDPHATPPDVASALVRGTARGSSSTNSRSGRLFSVSRRLGGPDRIAGVARFQMVYSGGWVNAVRLLSLAAGIGAAAAVAWGIDARQRRRRQRIAQGLQVGLRAWQAGETAPLLPEGGRDAWGELARTFNRSAAEIHDRAERLSRDHARDRAILRGMAEGVIAVEAGGRILYMNAAAARILSVSPEASTGRAIVEVARHRVMADLVRECLERNRDVGREATALVDSRPSTLEMRAAPYETREGTPAGAVIVFHDVTDVRHLETVRQEFVANISHELKTPITAIRAILETLIADPDMDASRRGSFLEKSRSQAERLSALVADILTLAHLEATTERLTGERLDLREPAREALATLAPAALERGVLLREELGTDMLPVRGDAEALLRVFSNLLENAIKYSPEGGHVELRLEREGERVRAVVADRGIGMEPIHLERIFERFYRVDRARSRELGGTGLGLSIVKHVCQTHGGEVHVESAPGLGSTFTVHFPLDAD